MVICPSQNGAPPLSPALRPLLSRWNDLPDESMPILLLGNIDSNRDCRPDNCREDVSREPGGGGGRCLSGGFPAEKAGVVAVVLPPPTAADGGVSPAEAVAVPVAATVGVG